MLFFENWGREVNGGEPLLRVEASISAHRGSVKEKEKSSKGGSFYRKSRSTKVGGGYSLGLGRTEEKCAEKRHERRNMAAQGKSTFRLGSDVA